jgi:ABC-type multidrug transport system ATPase subunit
LSVKLTIERLAVDRGGMPVLADFSHAFEGPAWVGIVGANGSGKTTLLRAMAGRLPVRSGRILAGGADLAQDRAGRAELIGFAVESAALPPELSPREIFAISARRRDSLDDPAIAPLREALNVEPFLDRKCGTLSAGMGHRVALLAAFLDLPEIVILDEPFNWLDPLTAYDVKIALRDFVAERGIALITALHDVTTLTAYCNGGILLAAGRIALTMDEAELRSGLADPAGFEAFMVERLRASR